MVKLEDNTDRLVANLENACKKTLFLISNQILNDCNLYVRVDTGQLRMSSARGSNLSKGIIGWDTSYAKKVYFTGKPSTDKNPNASLMWVEVARAKHGADWNAFVKSTLQREMK